MRKFIRTINSYFITGILAVFYIFAIGFSFLMLKIRDLVTKKRIGGWEEPRPISGDFSSPI